MEFFIVMLIMVCLISLFARLGSGGSYSSDFESYTPYVPLTKEERAEEEERWKRISRSHMPKLVMTDANKYDILSKPEFVSNPYRSKNSKLVGTLYGKKVVKEGE